MVAAEAWLAFSAASSYASLTFLAASSAFFSVSAFSIDYFISFTDKVYSKQARWHLLITGSSLQF